MDPLFRCIGVLGFLYPYTQAGYIIKGIYTLGIYTRLYLYLFQSPLIFVEF